MVRRLLTILAALTLTGVMVFGVALAEENEDENESEEVDTYQEAPLLACEPGVRASATLYTADGAIDEEAAHGGDVWTGGGRLSGLTYATTDGKKILTVNPRLDRGEPASGQTCSGTLSDLGVSAMTPTTLPAAGSFLIDVTLRYCLVVADEPCGANFVTGTFGAFTVEEPDPTPDENSPTPTPTPSVTPTTSSTPSPTPTATAPPTPSPSPSAAITPVKTPAISLSITSGQIGDSFTIETTDFIAGSNLTAWWDPYEITAATGIKEWSGKVELNGALADSTGKIVLDVSVPQDTYTGQHVVLVSNPEGQTARGDLTVAATETTPTIYDLTADIISDAPPTELTETEGFVAGRLIKAVENPKYRDPFPTDETADLIGANRVVIGGTVQLGPCQIALTNVNPEPALASRINTFVSQFVTRALAQDHQCVGVTRSLVAAQADGLAADPLAQALARLESANLSHLTNLNDPTGQRFTEFAGALDAYLATLNSDFSSVDPLLLDRADQILARYEDINNHPPDATEDRLTARDNAERARARLRQVVALIGDPNRAPATPEFAFTFNTRLLRSFPITAGLNEIGIYDGDTAVASIIIGEPAPTITLTSHKTYQIRGFYRAGVFHTELEFIESADNSWWILKKLQDARLGAFSDQKVELAETFAESGIELAWEDMTPESFAFLGNAGSVAAPQVDIVHLPWAHIASHDELLTVYARGKASEVAWVDPTLAVDWNAALAGSVPKTLSLDSFDEGQVAPRSPADWERQMHPFDVARRTDGVDYQEIVCYGWKPIRVHVTPFQSFESPRDPHATAIEVHNIPVAVLHTERVALLGESIAAGNWNGIGRAETCDDVIWRTSTDGLPNPVVEYARPRGIPLPPIRLNALTTPHRVFIMDDVTPADPELVVVPKELKRNRALRLEAEAKAKEDFILAFQDREIDVAFTQGSESDSIGLPYIAEGPWDEPGLARAANLLACAQAGTCPAVAGDASTGTSSIDMMNYPVVTAPVSQPLAALAADAADHALAFVPTNYLEIVLEGGPLALLVTDPTGRSAGVNPLDGQVIEQLGEALYQGAKSTANTLLIPGLKRGEYALKLIGLSDSDYHGEVRLALNGELVTKELNGTIKKDQVVTESIQVDFQTEDESITDSTAFTQQVVGSDRIWWWVIGLVSVFLLIGIGITIIRKTRTSHRQSQS